MKKPRRLIDRFVLICSAAYLAFAVYNGNKWGIALWAVFSGLLLLSLLRKSDTSSKAQE
jgi:uncharacterized membrane protein